MYLLYIFTKYWAKHYQDPKYSLFTYLYHLLVYLNIFTYVYLLNTGAIVTKILNIPIFEIQNYFLFQCFTFHLLLLFWWYLQTWKYCNPGFKRFGSKMELVFSNHLESFMCLYTTVKNKTCTKYDFDTLFQTSYDELAMVPVITFNWYFTLMPTKWIM